MTYKRKTRPAPWTLNADMPPKKRQRRIPRVSARRAARLGEYAHAKRLFLAELRNWYCPVMLHLMRRGVPTTDIHHKRGRIGALLMDQRYWLAVSRRGHTWIHDNPDAARSLGWLCERGDWNKA
jgi:hypothetical protein